MAGTKPVTDYDEVQSNEIEVLKSIFIEDFKEETAKAGPWNVCERSAPPLRSCRTYFEPNINYDISQLSLSLLLLFGRKASQTDTLTLRCRKRRTGLS